MQELSVLISLLAPLVSFATACLVPSRYPRMISGVVNACMLLSCAAAAFAVLTLWNTGTFLIQGEWFALGTLRFGADLAVSNESLLMLGVVSFISLLVHVYSVAYMAGDADWKKYFAMLGFFTFSMQGIVLSDNLLFLFIFWELVGFSSYMLIGHWTAKPEAGRAATKAFVMNRIGDAGFLVGLMIIWTTHETFSLAGILTSAGESTWQTAAGLCIFCGVIGKSAQFPLFTWLPDAMEGPTPVSALIHAATMVAAGVYLLIRVFPVFTESALLVIAIVGMITTLMGALAALSQHDIKKILAYSTMSQLGLMVVALGAGVVGGALLHLVAHAFFKACLFLSAGMIIHSLHRAQPSDLHFDVQDIRNMGGLRTKMPTTFFAFLFSGASLAGVPFFSGFLSKEAIITTIFMHTHLMSWLMLVVILTVSFITVVYTFRMIWLIFMGEARAVKSLDVSEPGWLMRGPVILLSLFSLWLLVSWNPFDFRGWIFVPQETSLHSLWITLFSVVWVASALVLSWRLFQSGRQSTNDTLRNAFYIDRAYTSVIGRAVPAMALAVTSIEKRWIDGAIHAAAYGQVILAHVVSWVDRVLVDGTVNATARLTGFGGKITRSFQGGNIQLYIFWALIAIIIFIIWTLN